MNLKRLIPLTPFQVRNVSDSRGLLGVVEGVEIPFDVKRLFWITGVPNGGIRGNHGHYKGQQLLVCLKGQVDIKVMRHGDSGTQESILPENTAFYLPPLNWISMRFTSPDDILLVAADTNYDPNDVFQDPIK